MDTDTEARPSQSEDGQLHAETPTFGKLMEPLMHNLNITDGAVRLYGHMHWRYGCNRKNHEGQQSMAEAMGVSEVTIRNRIDELEANDWVVTIWRESRGKAGSWQTNFYHVFESQETCRQFRKDYKPEKGEEIKPKPEARKRKSRKGIGGNPEWGGQNSSLDGSGQNSSLAQRQNSSLDNLDSVYPDSEKKKDSSPAEAGKGGGDSSASPAGEKEKPQGLVKSSWYPVNGVVVDDPFRTKSTFLAAQAKGHHKNTEPVQGKRIMQDAAFAGLQVVEADRRYGYRAGKRKSQSAPPSKDADPLYHLIAEFWCLPVQITGRVFQIKHFITGTSQKGDWGKISLDPPMDLRELRSYKAWRDDQEPGRKGYGLPEGPVSIQKSVWLFRSSPQYQFYLRQFTDDPAFAQRLDEKRELRNDGVSRGQAIIPEYTFPKMKPKSRERFLRLNGYGSDREYCERFIAFLGDSHEELRTTLAAMAAANEVTVTK